MAELKKSIYWTYKKLNWTMPHAECKSRLHYLFSGHRWVGRKKINSFIIWFWVLELWWTSSSSLIQGYITPLSCDCTECWITLIRMHVNNSLLFLSCINHSASWEGTLVICWLILHLITKRQVPCPHGKSARDIVWFSRTQNCQWIWLFALNHDW